LSIAADSGLAGYGDRIREGRYVLHSRFDRACNFIDGVRLVSVVRPDVGGGPLNLVLSAVEPAGLQGPLLVSPDGFSLDGRFFARLSPVEFDSSMELRGLLGRDIGSAAARLRELLRRGAPAESVFGLLRPGRRASDFEAAMAARFRSGAAALTGPEPLTGVRKLRGLGAGLTPAGDDLLCGFFTGCRIREHILGESWEGFIAEALEAARGGNAVSNAFLGCAAAGRLFERFQSLVRALCKGGPVEAGLAFERVLAVGATSGADWAAGLLLALEKLVLSEV